MSADKTAFRKQLQIIRDRFISESKAKLDELDKFWQKPQEDKLPELEDLNGLFRLSHNFTGSGASFGMRDFSERARTLEFYVQAMIDGKGQVSDTQRQTVCRMLDRLKHDLAEAEGSPMEERDTPVLAKEHTLPRERHNRRLFLVEDDSEQASELTLQLGFLGYEVFSFDSPQAACDALDEHNPAVMLMDIVFPEGPLAGPQTLKSQNWPPGHIPIVFLSVRRDFESRLAAMRAGGTHYLPKPIDIRRLAEILGELTSGRVQGPYRVLIVDDEPQEAALHSLMLERAGMVTFSVHQPSEALTTLERFKPDLILMDLYMPECDGAELANIIRQHETYSTTPIIFLSSEERFEKKVDAMRAGGEDFLTKPVGHRELVAMVELRANRARELRSLNSELGSLLRDFENQKRALDAHAPIMLTDLLGRVTYANDRMLKLLGTTLVNLLGTDLKEPPYRKTFPEGLWHNVDSGHIWRGKVRLAGVEGDTLWLSLTVVPSRDIKNKITSHIWIAYDITTFHKQKESLAVALEQAESALKTKRDLLACTSHEMRSSLNGLAGMARLLKDTDLSRDQKEFVDGINTATNHLVGVINQTLDFSKIEAGKLDLEHIAFPLHRCIEDVGELMSGAAAEKHLELALQIHPDVPHSIYGDPLRLRQILINLVGNAIKFTESGTILIKLYVIEKSGDSASIRFEVQDTGIGIPRNKQGLLFRFFSQTDASTSRNFGGTGLGLAISARLTEAMGGHLEVSSEEGEGSCFHFQITTRYLKNKDQMIGELSGWRVLLICGQEATTVSLAQQLEGFGCRFKMVQNEAQAWNTCASYDSDQPFDVVLYLLEDREQAAMFANEFHGEYPHVHLTLMTSFAKVSSAKELLENGFDAYFLLPVRRKAFFQALRAPKNQQVAQQVELDSANLESLKALRSNYHILLAEDNPVNRRITLNVLTNGGYQCDAVVHGGECLEWLESGKPVDLVLMDCQMPVVDGYEALSSIRAMDRINPLPVIAMTGNPYEDDTELQFDAHLVKPVEPSHLFKALDKVLLGEQALQIKTKLPGGKRRDPVDLSRFVTLTQHDHALERSLVEMFLINIGQELVNLETSLRHLDATSALQLAHGIKGACLEIGARDLARIAGRLEQLSAEGDLDQTPALFASLKSEYGRVDDYLNEYIRREGEIHGAGE